MNPRASSAISSGFGRVVGNSRMRMLRACHSEPSDSRQRYPLRGEVPTPATDNYAFGATAFHLATGRPPFYRGNVIDAHLKDAPPDPRDSVPDLHPDLARIILRCLGKQPGERFQAADELRDELLRLPERLT